MEEKRQIVVAAALIRNGEDKILLQKRIDPAFVGADGKWEFPGGRVDWNEAPADAAKREVREEIGCEVSIQKLVPFVWSNVWRRVDGSDQHVIVICFEAAFISGTPKPLDKKVAEVGWFAKEEALQLDLLAGIKELITAAG
jgi:8-oxo-dGTP diphosphatase